MDELDRKASSLLADHSHRTEVQLSQLNDEKSLLAEVAAAAFDEFDVTMSAQLRVELLKLAESQRLRALCGEHLMRLCGYISSLGVL